MSWKGYGLSFWRCKCGAARRVTQLHVTNDHISSVDADPCKRCGTVMPPETWPDDPWLGVNYGCACSGASYHLPACSGTCS